MKKYILWGLWSVVALVIVAFSVKVERLDARSTEKFDPAQEVARFWVEELPALLEGERVVDADLFRNEVLTNRSLLIDRYGITLGIGAPYSMLVKGRFEIEAVGDELIRIVTPKGAAFDLRRAYIFGNTVREASGAFSIDDYENTMDFNLIASELNRCVLERVIAPIADQFEAGSHLQVVGALDVRADDSPKGCFELIPLTVQIAQ